MKGLKSYWSPLTCIKLRLLSLEVLLHTTGNKGLKLYMYSKPRLPLTNRNQAKVYEVAEIWFTFLTFEYLDRNDFGPLILSGIYLSFRYSRVVQGKWGSLYLNIYIVLVLRWLIGSLGLGLIMNHLSGGPQPYVQVDYSWMLRSSTRNYRLDL